MKYKVGQRIKVTCGVFKNELGTIRVVFPNWFYYIDFDKEESLKLKEICFNENEIELCQPDIQ